MGGEQRIDRLEREVRLLRKVVVVLAMLMIAGVTMAQREAQEQNDYDSITCRSLHVVGMNNQNAVTIESGKNGGIMRVWNGEGFITIELGQTEYQGGLLAIKSQTGRERIKLSTVESGGAVVVSNKHDDPVIDLYPDDAGDGRVGIWTRSGTGRLCEPHQ